MNRPSEIFSVNLGVGMNRVRIAVLAVAALVVSAASIQAQNWPKPTRVGQTPTTYQGKPLAQFDSPLAKFTGRFVDSSSTSDRLGPHPRTLRAKGIAVDPAEQRIYVRLGETFVGYDMQMFFSSLGGGMRSTSIGEKYLDYQHSTYPESGGGWQTYVIDGQDRLFQFAFDDRDYVYVTYSVWGWGILTNTGFNLVHQELAGALIPEVIGAFKGGGKYYVLVSGGEGGEIWDVTNPSSPTRRRTFHEPVYAVSTIRSGSDDLVAIATSGATSATLDVYRGSALAAGGSPIMSEHSPSASRFTSVTNDGLSFWATEAPLRGRSTRLFRATFPNPSSDTYTTGSEKFSDRKGTGVQYGAGYLTMWGEDSDSRDNLWLFKINGTTDIEEISLNDYPRRAYTGPSTSEYVTPLELGYTQRYRGSIVVSYQGKDYLIICAHGIGDVYELEAPNRLSLNSEGVAGTPNSRSLSTETGPFYGDPIRFNSNYGGGSVGVTWNFGNPEGIAEHNIRNVVSGQAVTHQFGGLTTAAAIQTTRQVTVSETNNPSNSSSINVSMKVPQARIATDAGAQLKSGDSVFAGSQLWDGSDGRIESHYVTWNLGGTETTATPASGLTLATCGPQNLTLTARYTPYTVSGGTPTPSLESSKHFVATASANFNVLAFQPVVAVASSSASSITFRNDSLLNAAAYDPSGNWVVTWELRDSTGAVIATETDTSAIGTKNTFIVSKSIIPASGGKVVMKVESDTDAWVPASCQSATYATATGELALAPPDPVINQTGCASKGAQCQFTVTSASGKSVAAWAIQWQINNAAAGAGTSISPNLDAGTHTIAVNVSNDFGSASRTKSVTVTVPACASKPGLFSLGWQGATSGCTGTACFTQSREPLKFKATPFGYTFQDCDQFSWNFGDGTTSTLREPTHSFSTDGPHVVRLTVTNTSGTEVATSTIQWGSGGNPGPGPTPTCTKPPAGTVFPSFTGATSGCKLSDQTCATGESIQFTATTWGYNIQSCDTFSWNFGDGGTSTSRNPTHVYQTAGTYTARLTITNSAGSTSGTVSVKVGTVKPPDSCPSAPGFFEIGWTGKTSSCTASSGQCQPNETVDFRAHPWGYSFQDCDQFLWDFGDGTTSTSRTPSHKFPATGGEFIVKLTVTNTKGTKAADPKTIVLGTPATPPTSVSISAPARAKPGEAITFTATTQGGDPATQFQWNFGDGGTATGKTVTHSFVTEGKYGVSVVASNSGGSVQVVRQIEIAATLTYLLPVVTHADGSNNSSWRTDLHVYQPQFGQTGPIEVQLDFKGINKKIFFDSSTEIFEDVLGEITSADDAGPVFVHTPVPIDMWTRTYNLSASGVGTYGQLIPAMLLSNLSGSPVGEGTFWNIGGLKNTDRFRTNIGFVNPHSQRADITVYIYEEEFGLEIGRFDVSIDPFQLRQDPLIRWFPAIPGGKGFSLRVKSKNGLDVVSYASVIDNVSNDPVFIGAVPDAIAANPEADVQIVPGVGHVGAWRSDLAIFNPDAGTMTALLEFYNQDGAKMAEAPITLPHHTSLTVEDVLRSNLMNIETEVFGTMKVSTTSSATTRYPIIFDRTYNDQGPLGTYGQGIQAFPASAGNARANRPAFVPGVRSDSAYYTNLGLVSLSDSGQTELSLQLLHPIDGRALMVRPYTLNPGQAVIINDALANFFLSSSASGTLKIEVISGGPVWAYASVIDRLTKDPEYVPAVPSQQTGSSMIGESATE